MYRVTLNENTGKFEVFNGGQIVAQCDTQAEGIQEAIKHYG